jgi:hypothetical protein
MKKIIKLTESDLKKVLKKIISESLLLESSPESLSRSQLEQTYTKYNDMGSQATFNELFQSKIEKGIKPYTLMLNGCATKVSLALDAAGQPVDPPNSSNYGTTFKVTDGEKKGKNVNVNAGKLKDELIRKWGQPDVKIGKVTSLEEVQNKIGPGRSGVYICAPCGFGSGASGHATVWSWWKNNNKGGPSDYSTYPEENGGTIYFWQVGGTNEEVAIGCGYKNWDEYKKSNYKCKTDYR